MKEEQEIFILCEDGKLSVEDLYQVFKERLLEEFAHESEFYDNFITYLRMEK